MIDKSEDGYYILEKMLAVRKRAENKGGVLWEKKRYCTA